MTFGRRKPEEYVALKVYVSLFKEPPELGILDHLKSVNSEDPGRPHVRQLLDWFEVTGPYGMHTCLVHATLGINFTQLLRMLPTQCLDGPQLEASSCQGKSLVSARDLDSEVCGGGSSSALLPSKAVEYMGRG